MNSHLQSRLLELKGYQDKCSEREDLLRASCATPCGPLLLCSNVQNRSRRFCEPFIRIQSSSNFLKFSFPCFLAKDKENFKKLVGARGFEPPTTAMITDGRCLPWLKRLQHCFVPIPSNRISLPAFGRDYNDRRTHGTGLTGCRWSTMNAITNNKINGMD